MHYGHPQQTQIVGRVPIGVGLVAASLTGEVLAPAPTKTAAARDAGLVLDEGPKLKEAPARVVPADRFRNGRPATDAGQVFETDPSTHRNRVLADTFADGVVLRRLETSLLTRQPFQDRATTSSR